LYLKEHSKAKQREKLIIPKRVLEDKFNEMLSLRVDLGDINGKLAVMGASINLIRG
jgi:hypothetical protein